MNIGPPIQGLNLNANFPSEEWRTTMQLLKAFNILNIKQTRCVI
jgi:hypothetical protein